MNQLTITDKQNIESLPVQLQPFVKAKFGFPINKIEPYNLHKQVLDLVQVTLMESGVKDQSDLTVINFLTETLVRDLQTPKFNHLSFEDIKLALNLGVRREYGEYMGVNIQTIHSWIKSFISDKNRELALKEFNSKLPVSNKPLVYTEEYYLAAAKRAFDEYKQTGAMPISGAAASIYDLIKNKLGLKTLIAKENWEFVKNEAKKNYDLKMNPPKFSPSGKQKTVEKIKLDFSLTNASFEFEIKKIGLQMYFDELIKKNKDLEL